MGTAAKALKLLDLFTSQRPEIGLSDVARLSCLNKATALRLLRDLESAGMVEQVFGTKAYRLGPAFLRLAALRERAVPWTRVADHVLSQLAETTGETAHIGLMEGGRLMPAAHFYSTRHATRVMLDDIDILDFHATGSGLAVLAFLDATAVDRILAEPLKVYTAKTLVEPQKIRAMLSEIRQQGFASSLGGVEDDVHSISAPFFNTQGKPEGSITIAAPIQRLVGEAHQKVIDAVMAAAGELTAAMGGRIPETKGVAA